MTYFTAIGNNGNDYYESSWSNIAGYALPGVGTVNADNVGGGSPYETITINPGTSGIFDLQWASAVQVAGGGAAAASRSAWRCTT